MKKIRLDDAFRFLNGLVLSLMSFTFLYPFWRIIALSLNDGIDAQAKGIYFWPRRFTLDNYMVIFSNPDIVNAYKVTVARTVIGTVLSVFLMALMGYGLSKRHLIGRKVFNVMILITMFFSGGLIPLYLLLGSLSLLNSFWVFVIPTLYQAWNVILFRTFFRGLPGSLEESAKIDGANDLVVFFRIAFPLSLPIIATISLFVAVVHWNDWFSGYVYVTRRELFPLQSLLMRIITENDTSRMILGGGPNMNAANISRVTPYSVRMATLVAIVLPIMAIYPFLQKYFVKGVLVGSIKG